MASEGKSLVLMVRGGAPFSEKALGGQRTKGKNFIFASSSARAFMRKNDIQGTARKGNLGFLQKI